VLELREGMLRQVRCMTVKLLLAVAVWLWGAHVLELRSGMLC
jgi:hypothetical protein